MCVVWVRVLGMARVVLMDKRVPASPGDEPAADRKGGCADESRETARLSHKTGSVRWASMAPTTATSCRVLPMSSV